MPRMSKIVHCVDCQEPLPNKLLNRMGRCYACALFAGKENVTQLRDHSGPYYEKWKAAMKERIGRL